MTATPSTVSPLHDPGNSERILQMTADTMFLLDTEGRCVDMVLHTDRWFLQRPDRFIGKRMFDLIPSETSIALWNNFKKVLLTGNTSTDNYEIQLGRKAYFFKCILYKYDNQHILCQYRDITQRILLKQRLEQANYRLREIEKVAKIGHWHYDTKKAVFFYNGIFGVLSSDTDYASVSQADFLESVHPDDKEAFLTFISKQKQEIDDFLNIRLSIKGKTHHLLFKTLSTYKVEGIRFLEGYVQNITGIKRQQHKLEIVTRAVSNSTDYIFAMKTDGQLVYGNQQFNTLHGWEPEADIAGFTITQVKNGWISSRRWMELIKQVVSTNQIVNFVLNRPEGETRGPQAFDCTMYLTKDSFGESLIWTFGKDITDRVYYEKQVKELNQIMSTVLRNIPMHISVKDVAADLRYIFSNREGGDFNTGLSGQLIGKRDYDMYDFEKADNLRMDDLKVMQSEGEIRRILEDKDEDGQIRLTEQLRLLIKDELRPLILTIEQDITRSKLMEQELVDAKERAIEADKLKSAFIANMSHEIRTPLNAIVGFSKIIAETEDATDRASYYSIVEANNERLLGLINEILDLSKIESGIMAFDETVVKIKDFAEDLLHTLSIKCPEGVNLLFEPADDELAIFCDRNRLSQVVSNLITNAFKFTTKGSITFGFTRESTHLQFYVRDTGKGIAPEKVDKVFDRFVKADNFTQGTGLGLSICRSIVERCGGRIWLDSEWGKGSTFYFSMPLNKVVTGSQSDTISIFGDTLTDPQNITILVAEDTDSNFKLIEAMIGRTFKLTRAHNGLEAVSMFFELKPDLVLMDIKMPELSGLDATALIRESDKTTPIIAQSAFAFEDDRRNAMEKGCSDFLAKPFSKKQLTAIIQRNLNPPIAR